VRALEIALGGSTITAHDEETKKREPRFDARIVVLGLLDRAKLYERINLRVDEMVERGLVDEVRRLMEMGFEKSTALQAIGYKELREALRGECSVEDAVERIKLGSRRYAKRQISWNTRYSGALRINWENFPNIDDALHASTEFFQK
jgi:tRNA dimethylallyltransferase